MGAERDALELDPERQPDGVDDCAEMFQAALVDQHHASDREQGHLGSLAPVLLAGSEVNQFRDERQFGMVDASGCGDG